MIRIHVTNVSFRAFPKELRDRAIIPELTSDRLPLTPQEIIKSAPHELMSGKEIVTCSEVFILFVLYCIRRTTRVESTPLGLTPSVVQMFYHSGTNHPTRLRIERLSGSLREPQRFLNHRDGDLIFDLVMSGI